MTILEALRDPALFGKLPAFQDLTTWRRWMIFLRAFYGLPLVEPDLSKFVRHTGRWEPREGGYSEAVVIVGRQSGKTQVAAVVGTYEAAQAIRSGERGVYVPLIAQDLRGAQRALFRYVQEAVRDSELLSREVTRETQTELELAGRVTIGVLPCRPQAVRGYRAAFAAVDELAHFLATDGKPTDKDMLTAARPTLATTGPGRLLVLSSPYAMSGALFDLHRRHHGREDSEILVWQATAPEMNPSLPADYLRRMEQDDPEAYRSEVLGEFRPGIATFLDPEALAAVVDTSVRERQPVEGVEYVGYVDAASGSGKDAFAMGIAHREGERALLDVCRAWKPPFNPSGVIAEASDVLRRYGIRSVSGDKYAPGFVAEGFRRHGIEYEASKRTTSETYLELLPLINSGAVVVLDHSQLLKELRGLERRTGNAGRDRIDHKAGSHDDRAVGVAGALVEAAREESTGLTWGTPGWRAGTGIPRQYPSRGRGQSPMLDALRRQRAPASGNTAGHPPDRLTDAATPGPQDDPFSRSNRYR